MPHSSAERTKHIVAQEWVLIDDTSASSADDDNLKYALAGFSRAWLTKI